MRKDQQQSSDYLKLNPKHKVPLLVVDSRPLSENVAIQIWIARNFPKARLLPDDPWQQLQAISLLAWCASGIHPYLSRINSTARVCDLPGAHDSVRRLAAGPLVRKLQDSQRYACGPRIFLRPFHRCGRAFLLVFPSRLPVRSRSFGFPNCRRHFERMKTRPSVQKLLAYEKKVKQEFGVAA